MLNLITKNIKVIFLMGLMLPLFSCNDDNNNNPNNFIPNVNVNFYIYPNTIDFIEVGGFREYNNQGHRGVIVYRFDQTTFIAYEKTCPYDANLESAVVEVHIPTFSLVDSTCMSSYNLVDGMPNAGPSSIALLQYGTYYDGNQLHIYNN
jgi:hypothetical protein